MAADRAAPAAALARDQLHAALHSLDQANLAPALSISYKIIKDGQTVLEVKEESGESVQYFSGQRVVLIKNLPIKDLEPGKYSVSVDVKDLISNQKIAAQDNFQLTVPPQVAAK